MSSNDTLDMSAYDPSLFQDSPPSEGTPRQGKWYDDISSNASRNMFRDTLKQASTYDWNEASTDYLRRSLSKQLRGRWKLDEGFAPRGSGEDIHPSTKDFIDSTTRGLRSGFSRLSKSGMDKSEIKKTRGFYNNRLKKFVKGLEHWDTNDTAASRETSSAVDRTAASASGSGKPLKSAMKRSTADGASRPEEKRRSGKKDRRSRATREESSASPSASDGESKARTSRRNSTRSGRDTADGSRRSRSGRSETSGAGDKSRKSKKKRSKSESTRKSRATASESARDTSIYAEEKRAARAAKKAARRERELSLEQDTAVPSWLTSATPSSAAGETLSERDSLINALATEKVQRMLAEHQLREAQSANLTSSGITHFAPTTANTNASGAFSTFGTAPSAFTSGTSAAPGVSTIGGDSSSTPQYQKILHRPDGSKVIERAQTTQDGYEVTTTEYPTRASGGPFSMQSGLGTSSTFGSGWNSAAAGASRMVSAF